MPCLPGKKMFITKLFGKRIKNKIYSLFFIFNISRMPLNKVFMFLINPPSGNAEIQKLMAKHVFECFEKRKGEDGNKTVSTLGLNINY